MDKEEVVESLDIKKYRLVVQEQLSKEGEVLTEELFQAC